MACSRVLGSLILCAAGAFGTCREPPPAPPDPSRPAEPGAQRREFALALSRAMLMHDVSIRGMEYRQRVDLSDGGAFVSHSLMDDQRRWWCDVTTIFSGVPKGAPASQRGVFVCDGELMATHAEGTHVWVIRQDQGERFSYRAGGTLWGRWLDRVGQQRLGELLLSAKDLAVSSEPGAARPTVEGTVEITPLIARLVVEIDPAHGFAPSRITVRDRALNVPYYEYIIEQFAQVDGTWMPVKGRERTRYVKRLSQLGAAADRFRALVKAAGFDGPTDLFDPRVQERYREIVREAYGADEAPSEPMGPEAVYTIEYVGVNRPLPDAMFKVEFGKDDTVYDALRDRVKKPGTDAWEQQ